MVATDSPVSSGKGDPVASPDRRQLWLGLAAILAAAVVARIGVRAALGDADYWNNNYLVFYAAAEHLAHGGGFCVATRCSRPPIYVSFLAITTFFGKHYLLIVVPQALLGAATAFVAFLIGRQIFTVTVGLIACAVTAAYPYYVMHDTALQDTGMVTFALALSVWLILRASSRHRRFDWALAGFALGCVVLVRVAMAPSVAVVLLWILIGSGDTARARLRATAATALVVAATVSPWLVYTAYATGAPVLSTDVGYELWVGNNPDTFSHFPAESIDRSSQAARARFTAEERAELRRLAPDARAVDRWYVRRARDEVLANPGAAAWNALNKLVVPFSWRMSPRRDTLTQAAYAASYVPISVLGLIGMALAWRRPETALVALLFASFAAVTMVFSNQSGHRTYLDIYLIVYAAAVMAAIGEKLKRRTAHAQPDEMNERAVKFATSDRQRSLSQ